MTQLPEPVPVPVPKPVLLLLPVPASPAAPFATVQPLQEILPST